MVEQLLPVYSWEKVWYTAPTPHRIAGDHYRILSNTAGNLVNIQLDDGTFLPQVQVPTAADFAEVSWVTLWLICESLWLLRVVLVVMQHCNHEVCEALNKLYA